MPTVAHSTLTGAELHEPKGIDTAATGTILLKGQAGTGVWALQPFGMVTATNATETNNTSYTVMAKTGSAFSFGQSVIVEATGFGLKYTGATQTHFLVKWSGSITQDQAGTKQVYVKPYVNGTTALDYAETSLHVPQNEYKPIGCQFYYTFNQNDYIELFAYDADATHVITIINPVMIIQAVGSPSV